MVYTHGMTTTTATATATYYYVLADDNVGSVYGPYSTRAAAEADARRVRVMDWHATVQDKAGMERMVARAEAAGFTVQHKTPMPPR